MRSGFTSPTLELSKQKFLQSETENSAIFFLEEELILFELCPQIYLWSYCHYINDVAKFNTTTNAAETINKRLKTLCGSGYLPFKSACLKIHKFKYDCLMEFQTKVRNDNLNNRKRKTLTREDAILTLVRQFDALLTVEQTDINTNLNLAK